MMETKKIPSSRVYSQSDVLNLLKVMFCRRVLIGQLDH